MLVFLPAARIIGFSVGLISDAGAPSVDGLSMMDGTAAGEGMLSVASSFMCIYSSVMIANSYTNFY